MAAVAPAADQATDLLQKLTLESKSKAHDAPEVAKKPSGIQYGSANGVEAPKVQIQSSERSVTPVPEYMDHNIWYLHNGYPSSAYYYRGYDGSMGEWDEYSRYLNPEGVEMPHGVYGDMYHHGYGYTPYGYPSSGSAVSSLGHDSQMYGAQHYQYPSPYFQPQAVPNGTYSSNSAPPQVEVNSPAVADQPPVALDATKSNSNGVNNVTAIGNCGPVPLKQTQQNSSLTSNGSYGRGVLLGGHPSPGYQDPRFNFDGMRSPIPWYDGSTISDAYIRSATANAVTSTAPHNSNSAQLRNQNVRSVPQLMGLHSPQPTPGMGPAAHGIINRMYPTNRMYGQCGNTFRSGNSFGTNIYDSRINGRWGGMLVDGKYKPRGRGNGFYGFSNDNGDGFSELNRGPRANRFKNYKAPVPTVTIAAKGQTLPAYENVEDPTVVTEREQYNRADFSDKYSEAKFFVIKSYSEDDIHKSIKYNVWASTPNGNKKLDAAYKDAHDMTVECPVFLFFSVNTSGQFVGVAEMVGPVDFNKTVDYWQQDKWNGCFNVKWHIVKDVPNNILKHIIIESNDNKPVTNSRDTQEVKLEQGIQILKIFKEHVSKTSILDDFGFYETRQKVMQEKRTKQLQHSKLIVDLKPVDTVDEKGKDGISGNPRLQKPLESVTVLKKEVISVGLGERRPSDDNSLPAVASDVAKGARPAPEKRLASNGVTNGC